MVTNEVLFFFEQAWLVIVSPCAYFTAQHERNQKKWEYFIRCADSVKWYFNYSKRIPFTMKMCTFLVLWNTVHKDHVKRSSARDPKCTFYVEPTKMCKRQDGEKRATRCNIPRNRGNLKVRHITERPQEKGIFSYLNSSVLHARVCVDQKAWCRRGV